MEALHYSIKRTQPQPHWVKDELIIHYTIQNQYGIKTMHQKEEIQKWLVMKLRDAIDEDCRKMRELEEAATEKTKLITALEYLEWK